MELEAVPLSREQTLHIALGMGKALLKNGAETSRVEDTISRFCHTHGYHDIHVFVTPTVIILGDEESEGATIISRIRYRSTNLSVISAVNDFSYNLKRWPMNYEETLAYLEELRHKAPPYGEWRVCMASAISSAAFSAMLGGNSHDFIAAFITGGLSMVLLKQLGGYRPSAFWENALSGAAIGALAIFCCEMDGECTRTNIIVGALMPFLPGVAFTNGLRDYMAGEVSKDLTMRMLLPPEIVKAHEEGIIHFHDADYYAQHMHNCDLVNLDDMLQNGTVISGTLIEKPHSFSTACNILSLIHI